MQLKITVILKKESKKFDIVPFILINMRYIFILFIILFSDIAFCQIDTSKIIYASKVIIVADYYESEINNSSLEILIKDINCEFLENNLFKYNFVVLNLTVTNNTLKEHLIYNLKSDSLDFVNNSKENNSFGNLYCDYIIAYNFYWNRIFRLKGFKTNEFYDFYNLISNDILNNTPNNLIPTKSIFRKKRIRNLLLSKIDIKKLDMRELYKKYYFNNSQYPIDDCSCAKRDNEIHVLK